MAFFLFLWCQALPVSLASSLELPVEQLLQVPEGHGDRGGPVPAPAALGSHRGVVVRVQGSSAGQWHGRGEKGAHLSA